MDRTRSLTAGPVGLALISLAWPILCSGLVEALDTSANVMWVGRELGDVSLAALSNANLLWAVLFVGASGVSMAGTVWIGRSLGKGDIRGAKAAVGTMASASIVLAVMGILPVIIWAHSLLGCLGTPAAARPQAAEYLRILLLSVPLTFLSVAIMAALQASGDSRTGFYFAAACVLVDATLNPLLILGLGPFPRLGISGSALATVIAEMVRLAGLLIQVYRARHALRLRRGELGLLRIDWMRAASVLGDGGPMAVQMLWTSIENMVMMWLVNRFGADVTAAYGAVAQLWNLIILPAAALGVAMTATVAQNIGAGRWDRVRIVSRLGLMYGVLATAALVALTEIFGPQICRVFLPAASPAIGHALAINREALWSLIPLSGYTVWVGVLRATGAVWAPLGISAGVLAVRFPVTAALLGRWQMHAIWWSFPASAATTCVIAALHAYFGPRVQWPSADRGLTLQHAVPSSVPARMGIIRTRNC